VIWSRRRRINEHRKKDAGQSVQFPSKMAKLTSPYKTKGSSQKKNAQTLLVVQDAGPRVGGTRTQEMRGECGGRLPGADTNPPTHQEKGKGTTAELTLRNV